MSSAWVETGIRICERESRSFEREGRDIEHEGRDIEHEGRDIEQEGRDIEHEGQDVPPGLPYYCYTLYLHQKYLRLTCYKINVFVGHRYAENVTPTVLVKYVGSSAQSTFSSSRRQSHPQPAIGKPCTVISDYKPLCCGYFMCNI